MFVSKLEAKNVTFISSPDTFDIIWVPNEVQRYKEIIQMQNYY